MPFRCVNRFSAARRLVCGGMFVVVAPMQLLLAQQHTEGAPGGSVDPQLEVLLSHSIGKDGIPFPKSEESKWQPVRSSDQKAGVEPTEVPAPTPTPYQQPKRCTVNETKRVVYKEQEAETKVYTDYLFIPEELVPIEPEEVFGSMVSLIPYGPEAGDAAKIRMEVNAVPCLPYRRRLTNSTQYFDTGINALKNYDGAPGGVGKLHPLIQQKLHQSSTKSGVNRTPMKRR